MRITSLQELQPLLHQCGCKDYKLALLRNTEEQITIRDGQTDQMQMSDSLSLCINLLMDGRDGFFYTQDLERASLDAFIREAVRQTLLLAPDDSRTLADPSRYYRGDGPDLHIFDPALEQVSTAEKVQMALEENARIVAPHLSILSAETRYFSKNHHTHLLISNGFEATEQSTHCGITDIVTLDAGGGIHPMDGWGQVRICHASLPSDGIAQETLRRASRKIGQRPVASGRYTMIVEGDVAMQFIQPLLRAMRGVALQQKTSFLRDKLGQPIGSPLLSLQDHPLLPGTLGATHFDFDGVATKQRWLMEKGELKTYFLDTQYAHKLGMAPTTQSTHHTIFTPGEHSLEGLMEDAGRAILVTDFNGGNCDPVTGQFSYGIEGMLIEHGDPTQPICGMNVTGDILGLWHRLVAVGNDADPNDYDLIPSLVFDDVAFGGV